MKRLNEETMFAGIKISNLKKSFGKGKEIKEVLRGVNLSMHQGEYLGIVGESACGKTTLACCMVGLLPYDDGDITLSIRISNRPDALPRDAPHPEEKLISLNKVNKKQKNILLRTYMQYIFQNPGGSLHPKKRIRAIFKESIKDITRLTKKKLNNDIRPILDVLSLDGKELGKFPHNFSGGEKQRLCLARALMVEPSLLIADEPLSNMDVTTQAKILNYFKKIKDAHKVNLQSGIPRETQDEHDKNNKFPAAAKAMVLITHDLSAALFLCDSIAIMKDGLIIEKQSTDKIISNPIHSYTKNLIMKNKNNKR